MFNPQKVATYLDVNAGAPLHPKAREALLHFLGADSPVATPTTALIPNPSSIHSWGRKAKRALAEAREQVAASLGSGTDPEQVLFTSSGSEANQLVIQSVLLKALKKGPAHWITSSVEHDSVLQMVKWFQSLGGAVTLLPVDASGSLSAGALSGAVREDTALVTLVWVNNETGVILDLPQILAELKTQSVPLHLDCAQAWGKLEFNVNTLGINYATFSGHKIGGLAGTGVLWQKPGFPVDSLIYGKQEKGRRGGTENLLGLIALGVAANQLSPKVWIERVTPLRDFALRRIQEEIPGTRVNGEGATRVANTLNLSFDGVDGDGLVMALDLAGFSVSSGSACSSGAMEPSHVLKAMGKSDQAAMAAIRVSFSPELDTETLERFVLALKKVVFRVRASVQERQKEKNPLGGPDRVLLPETRVL